MKILSTILLLLVLAMNFKPCADELCVETTETVDTFLSNASEDAHNEKDDCSPFCYCACCSVRSFSATELQITFFSPHIPLSKTTLLQKRVPQISLPIWQPPQSV